MTRIKIALAIVICAVVLGVYFPNFSKMQELKETNRNLEEEIALIKEKNAVLEEKITRLKTDPVYVEEVARDKMKTTKKGEIVYRTE